MAIEKPDTENPAGQASEKPAPADSKFRNPETRVKINAETYMRFDGTDFVMLKNIDSKEALRIKYDIMLILYELLDWKSVGELTNPWPPEDQEKIMMYLEMMAHNHVIIDDETGEREASESGLSQHLGSNIHINDENHLAMLRD